MPNEDQTITALIEVPLALWTRWDPSARQLGMAVWIRGWWEDEQEMKRRSDADTADTIRRETANRAEAQRVTQAMSDAHDRSCINRDDHGIPSGCISPAEEPSLTKIVTGRDDLKPQNPAHVYTDEELRQHATMTILPPGDEPMAGPAPMTRLDPRDVGGAPAAMNDLVAFAQDRVRELGMDPDKLTPQEVADVATHDHSQGDCRMHHRVPYDSKGDNVPTKTHATDRAWDLSPLSPTPTPFPSQGAIADEVFGTDRFSKRVVMHDDDPSEPLVKRLGPVAEADRKVGPFATIAASAEQIAKHLTPGVHRDVPVADEPHYRLQYRITPGGGSTYTEPIVADEELTLFEVQEQLHQLAEIMTRMDGSPMIWVVNTKAGYAAFPVDRLYRIDTIRTTS